MSLKHELCHIKDLLFHLIDIRLMNRDIPRSVLRKSTRLGHHGVGIVLNRRVVLGENVFIGTNVTLGAKYFSKDCPVIEDNVRICANAVIIGDIVVGHDSIIGAGAVVFKDIPPFSLVVGINDVKLRKGFRGRESTKAP